MKPSHFFQILNQTFVLQNDLNQGILPLLAIRPILTHEKHEVKKLPKHLHVDCVFGSGELGNEEGDEVRISQNDLLLELLPTLQNIANGIENGQFRIEVLFRAIVESEQVMKQSSLEEKEIE